MAGSHYGSENAAGLLSSVGKALALATAEREVVGSIAGARPILKVLKELRNQRITFALKTARPWVWRYGGWLG